jgi:hypothetical protein
VEKTERFKALIAVRDDLEQVQVHPAPAMPRPVPMHPIAVNPFPTRSCGHVAFAQGPHGQSFVVIVF